MKFFATRLAALSLISLTAVSGFAQTNTVQRTNNTQRTKAQRVPAQTEATAPAAQAPATTSRASAQQNDTFAWIKARSTVGGFISSASDLSVGSATLTVPQGNQSFRGSGNLSTGSSLGVTAQLIEMKSYNWGWFASASLEQSREISSVNLNLNQVRLQGSLTNKPRFMPILLGGGAVYRFNDAIYVSGGLNYTIYNDYGSGDLTNSSMTPKIGYQYGAGFKPFPRLALEIMQRDVRYDLSGSFNGNRLSMDDVRLTGLNIIGRYEIQ